MLRALPRLVAAVALLCAASAAQPILTPDAFAGFPIGSDGNLLRWERIVEYFQLLDAGSERVQVRELGKTHNGNPFILATISSPANIARLAEIQAAQRRIAFPEGLSEAEIDAIAESSPAVVLVTCSIHASEIGATQMAVELAHQLAVDDSAWTRRVLDNVVFLLVPSFNPDGQVIVADWNNRVRGTERVWSSLPWLYHPYVGHDNNRDAFMMTQPESRYGNRILFQEWFPQVYVDQHQQGQNGMRVFVPPFSNPINPNVHPSIWAGAGKIGFAMYQALHEAGIDGVGYDARYTAWWQGGFLRGAWFHNIVGILTEVASANLASPTFQEKAELGRRSASGSHANWLDARERDPAAPMPPPSDVMPRYDYPRPWLGGKWTLRNIIDAELALTHALLESAADQRRRLIRTQIRMGLDAIAAGRAGDPWAYLFSPDQQDPAALYRLLEALHFCGVIVEQAEASFEAAGRSWPAGSYVIRMAQPFRAYARTCSSPRSIRSGLHAARQDVRPTHDLTAWTLPLQMGVKTAVAKDSFEADLRRLDVVPPPAGSWREGPGGAVIAAGPNNLATLISRLHAKRIPVRLLTEGAASLPAGSALLEPSTPPEVAEWVRELGLQATPAPQPGAPSQPLRPVRVALYRPWTASMDEGWTRWLLEQYEIAFTPLFDADIRAGELRRHWDVLLLPGDRNDADLVRGNERISTPEEYRGGIGEEGRRAIREFVAQGGRLVVWHEGVDFAQRTFELPLRDALRGVSRSQFSVPGSFLRIQVDARHPIGYGMAEESTAVFDQDSAFEPLPAFSYVDFDVVARYPSDGILQSGWMRGEQHLSNRIAAAHIRYKQGSIVMIGFRPQFRAQPHNTFKLLFNAIHTAGLTMER